MSDMNQAVQDLGAEFWDWRVVTGYRSPDDVPRLELVPDWIPQFDEDSARHRLEKAADFRQRWENLDVSGEPAPTQVDYRLIGSAISRVEWETRILRSWERDAVMQVHQALGTYYDSLLCPPPFDSDRQQGIIHKLHMVGPQLEVALENLARAGTSALAGSAIRLLRDIESALPSSVEELSGFFDGARRSALTKAGAEATDRLVVFREWLREKQAGMPPPEPVGRDNFMWYLRNVPLLPLQPEEMVMLAERELYRNYAWEEVERNRYGATPVPDRFPTAEAQCEQEARDEQAVREFYENENLLTQPDSLRRYLTAPLPEYVQPLNWLGVANDLTSDQRLDEDAYTYVWDPNRPLSYFYEANARDPRLGIMHEGVHYKQLALSWANPNPLRRRYYDSISNEGLAHYNEALMLQAGLFDDAPWSRLVTQNFKRLRSLRTVVDVSLATGAITLEEGMRMFEELIPVDPQTALEETSMYVSNPGLAMAYMVGKLEVIRLLADAKKKLGAEFSLRWFHDHLWSNGNVPISLLRWEMLDDPSDIEAIDRAG
ncbi:DUF885 family protein [Candidatus Spongiisocius sp.]|uniref:DUF885 family protein n=1 Tax=Candidatus Spongiisocius sp. TaxID=3101273 RepID=UPI003B5A02A5